jgi:Bacterial Ig-like domain/Starch binding domain/Alpha amylase, catalytic domain/Fibronectin type III domain
MNYRFRNALIGLLRDTDWQDTNSAIPALTVGQFDSLMHSVQEDYPPEAWYALMNLVDSHDTNRVLIPLDQDGDPTDEDYSDGKARQNLLAIVQMTMPGAPTIYYGDEVGLVGYGQASTTNPGGVYYSDPYNRQPYPWTDEPGYDDLPAWRQQDTTLLAHYTTLTGIRSAHPALRTGSFDTLLVDDTAQVYAYGRKLAGDAAIVIVNRSGTLQGTEQVVTVDVTGYLPEGTALADELNTPDTCTVTAGQIQVAVPPMWGAILTVDAGQDLIAPDAPANLAASEGDGAVHLSWSAVSDPDPVTYNLYRSLVPGGGYTLIASGLAGTTYDDNTVVNGTWYYYVVTALDAPANESAHSPEAPALPHQAIGWAGGLTPPEMTHTVGLTPTAPISAEIWIAGLTGAVGQGEGVLAQLGLGLTGTLSTTWETWEPMTYAGDTGSGSNDLYAAALTPEITGTLQYLARFSTTGGRDWSYAYTAAGRRGTLTVNSAADKTPPSTPLNLRVTDWAANWIALAWDPPLVGDPTLYAYDLYRSEEGGAVVLQIARILTPTTTYTDMAVTTGHTYTYTVQAVDASFNRSGLSNQVQATALTKQVRVTFQVVVPPYTPADATVYLVGDQPKLCNWCDPQTVAMDHTGDVTWTKVISLADGLPIQYKYTRGNWNVNEWWGPIVSVHNRSATIAYGSNGKQTLADTVLYWRDPLVITHHPTAGETGVVATATISVTLSRYLDPTTIIPANVTLTGGAAPATFDIGFFHHDDMTATTILLTPTVPLDYESPYTVTLKTGLKGLYADNEGIALRRPYTWTFYTFPFYRCYLPLVLRGN